MYIAVVSVVLHPQTVIKQRHPLKIQDLSIEYLGLIMLLIHN